MIERIILGLVLFASITTHAQDLEKKYKSTLVETERLNMEYMDLGGEGSPLIIVQGAHNYFDQSSSNPYIQHSNNSWIEFYSMFTGDYHVMAPLKRGFGRTDLQLENENVETATKDLVSWMDSMKIEKAFFIGRDVSAQNMLQLAESYPERVLGVVFIDPTFVFTDVKDDVVEEFLYYSYTDSYSASEFQKFKLKKSQLYRPEIFKDSTKRIHVPALLFYHDNYSRTLEMGRMERFIKWVENTQQINWKNEYSSPEIANYFKELSEDKSRMHHIRDYLIENNPTPWLNESLIRAFGNYLVLYNETYLEVDDVREALMNVYFPVAKGFLYMSKK